MKEIYIYTIKRKREHIVNKKNRLKTLNDNISNVESVWHRGAFVQPQISIIRFTIRK